MRWQNNFYDFSFKRTATAAIEYNLLKADYHSWWISKMQSGRVDTLEERYAIKFCFKLGKNATETYGMLKTAFRPSCMIRALVFEYHKRFLSNLSLPIVHTLFSVTFGYSLSSEAVVMRQLRRWKRLWRKSLTRSHKRSSSGPSRSCWNSTTSAALQQEEITSKGTRVSCMYSQWKCSNEKKSGNLSYVPRIYIYIYIYIVGVHVNADKTEYMGFIQIHTKWWFSETCGQVHLPRK